MTDDKEHVSTLKLYFSLLEAAEAFGVSESQLRAALFNGELRAKDFQNDQPRLSRGDLQRWKDSLKS